MDKRKEINVRLMWQIKEGGNIPMIVVTDNDWNILHIMYRAPKETMFNFKMRSLAEIHRTYPVGDYKVIDHNVFPSW